jgi:hypothetical protein
LTIREEQHMELSSDAPSVEQTGTSDHHVKRKRADYDDQSDEFDTPADDYLRNIAEAALSAPKKQACGLTPSASVQSIVSAFSAFADAEDEVEEAGWVPQWRPGVTPPPRVDGVDTPPYEVCYYYGVSTPPPDGLLTPPVEAS